MGRQRIQTQLQVEENEKIIIRVQKILLLTGCHIKSPRAWADCSETYGTVCLSAFKYLKSLK